MTIIDKKYSRKKEATVVEDAIKFVFQKSKDKETTGENDEEEELRMTNKIF